MSDVFVIKKKVFYASIVSIILLVFSFNVVSKGEANNEYWIYASYVSLAITAYLAFVNRNNIIKFFIYLVITYFNYSFMHNRYLSTDEKVDVFFNQCADDRIYTIAIGITLVFSVILFFTDNLYENRNADFKDVFIGTKEQPMVVYALLILIEAYHFISQQAFEYGVTNISVAFIYCGNNKKLKAIVLIFAIFIFIQGVFSGLRVPVLPYIIGAFFMVFITKIDYKKLMGLFVVGVLFMTVMGIYGDTNGSTLSISMSVEKLTESGLEIDTSVFAFLHSFICVKVRDLVSFAQEMDLLKQFVLSQIIGSGSFKYAKLAFFTLEYYNHYAGLIWQYAFYFYLGWGGVILFSLILGLYINILAKVKKESSEFSKVLLIYFVAMIPKWYLYEPTSLFRGVLLLAVVYWGTKFMSKIIYKNYDNETNKGETYGC